MNNDDIIKLAIEHTINGLKFNEDGLLRFAKLLAQHEREACAEMVDSYVGFDSELSESIRARGEA
jgi:hypothetical protein